MTGLAVQLIGVSKSYGSTVALAGVDVAIGHGESVAVMGPSGSGKSTLALCVAGVTTPDQGSVLVESQNLASMSETKRSEFRLHHVGMVFQAGHLLSDLSTVENIAVPLMFTGLSRRKATSEASLWLEPLGLGGLGDRRPGELSGGQAQRVAIARAIAHRPKLVIADEPTGALDQQTSSAVMSLLVSAASELGTTLIVVTHDDAVAGRCRRRLDVVDGHVVSDRSAVAP